jgi:hypothetical protein
MVTVALEKGHKYPVKVEFLRGAFSTKMVWLPANTDPLVDAASAAQKADVVVAVMGITSKLEGEEMKVDLPGFKGGDRTSLNLPDEQEALLGALRGRASYFEGQPLYPFGYGLGYSKFEYSNLKLSTPQLDAGNPLAIDVDVRNASAKPGDEVVEVYVSSPSYRARLCVRCAALLGFK